MSRVLFACVALALASGASAADKKPEPKNESVAGKVTFKGKPLPRGAVAFYSDDGSAYSMPLAADGTYKLALPAGAYRLAVVVPAPKPADPMDPKGEPIVVIPKKYQSPETSGLTYKVIAGKQTFDIDLKD